MNARGITVDWLNFYQPRRERITVLLFHGFAPVSFARLIVLTFRIGRCFGVGNEIARF